MKKLLLIVFVGCLIGCRQSTPTKPRLFTKIIKIRDCEYLESSVNSGYTYEHLGDCSNPAHQVRKEAKDVE